MENATSNKEQPNVLLLLTDQERYDLSSPNGMRVETSALDRLQAEGMRFDRAYSPISICTSARASLLTGLYPHNHGMLNNSHENDAVATDLSPDLPTFGELLTDAGYENSYVGKWHVGQTATPEDFGFQYFGGADKSHDTIDGEFREYQRSLGINPDSIELEDEVRAYENDTVVVAAKTPIPKEATRTRFIADRTIERLSECSTLEQPFFHRSDFLGPHHPYVVPEPYSSMYDPEDIDPWVNYADSLEGKPQAHREYLRYRGVEQFDWETWSEVISKYFGFVAFIDDEIERILDALDNRGLAEDTVVVHTADHGDMTGSHQQFNKGPMMYEETYHIPLIVRWPNVVSPGTRSGAFVRLLDLMPTFLDIGDAEIPSEIDGRSLLPLLQGKRPQSWPNSTFAEYHGDEFGLYSQRMVRTERYKFVYNGPDRNELYDFRRDPHELQNLIDHSDYDGVRQELEQRLVDWMEATNDSIARWPSKVLGDR